MTRDPQMTSVATLEHNVPIGGLVPNTTYFYRLQGSALNGTIYSSALSQFKTLGKVKTDNKNVALLSSGASIKAVSSNFGNSGNSGGFGAYKAIDGNTASQWSSNADGNNAFIEVSLTTSGVVLDAVEVWSRSMDDGSAIIKSFEITTNNGVKFGPFILPDTSKGYRFDLGNGTEKADSVRLDVVESTGGNTGLVEFSIFSA
eukprot:CFRG7246T1